jgi:hypothetical protein
MGKTVLTGAVILLVIFQFCNRHPEDQPDKPVVPRLTGDWWQVTTTYPDIAPYAYTGGDNKVCDFTIFQARDSSWQLIACIRGNTYPGRHRFFYRWEAENITDTLWTESGVFLATGTGEEPDGFGFQRDTTLYKRVGLLQAPHCFVHRDTFYLFYNNEGAHCMLSTDGKNWEHLENHNGDFEFFKMGRDLMIFRDEERQRWISFYTDGSKTPQYISARYADTLTGNWSEAVLVHDGYTNTRSPIYPNEFAESPFVIRYGDLYYLFTQLHVFVSGNPLDFTNYQKVAVLESTAYHKRCWAPEIITDPDGRYYLAAYRPDGIWIVRMEFE